MRNIEGDAALHRAHEALDAGDAHEASYLTQAVLADARERSDELYEGRALTCLAHCDRQLSRLRSAHFLSRRAATLLRENLDLPGEVMALTMLAQTAANLGWLDEAVENAVLASALAGDLPASRLQPMAQNYLGVAFFWCRDYARAEEAFARSVDLARANEPTCSPFHPLLNLTFLEAHRIATAHYEHGAHPSTSILEQRIKSCSEVLERLGGESLMVGMTATARTLWHILIGLERAWNNDFARASAELALSQSWEERNSQSTWLTAMRRWLQFEVALNRDDFKKAERLGREMISAAENAEHEQLACLGHLLVATLLRTRGDSRGEADELQSLMKREQRARFEALGSRAQSARWQLKARASAEQIAQLESRSRTNERLALEDSLTGIPSRRALDRKLLEPRSAASDDLERTCIAFIDIDSFKQVNDTFSHHVGDQVLKVVAEIVSRSVRGDDFVARLSGDEFICLFKGSDLADAQLICERMQLAIRDHDWDAIAPGLRVTISVGVDQAREGESIDCLLQRSDKQMYVDKMRRLGAS